MHVLNVNASIELKGGAGGAERTFQMSRFLARHGVRCTVLTLSTGLDPERVAALAPAVVVAFPTLWARFQVPWIDWKVVRRLVKEADIIHLMAHWSVLNAAVYLAARLARKPYVVCPVGTLPLFGRSGVLKRLYNVVVGTAIVRNASGWIAVTIGEFPHFESYGIPASRVTVIPNGVCEDDFPATDTQAFLRRHDLPGGPIILFMGRLNPIKGPDLLLRAFFKVRDRLPGYRLVFAGPDGGMLSELREMASSEGLADRVHFLGYVNNDDKPAAYRCAKLLVVPSRQEAMSIVALEAGMCGTPVLLTDQCGFGDIRAIDPRLEVPATVDGIAEGLVRFLAREEVLKEIAPVWHGFVVQRYAWDSIAPRYLEFYRKILAVPLIG